MQTSHEIFFENSNDMCKIPSNSVNLVVTSPPYPVVQMWNEIFSEMNVDIKQALEDRNVNFIPIKKFAIFEFRKVLKQYKPDIVHVHDIKATLIAAFAFKNIPIVSHIHVNKDDMARVSLKSVLYLIAAKRVKRVIAVAKTCIDEYFFKKSIINKTDVLTNVVYSPRINVLINKDSQDYNFDFVFLGRLTHQKNPERVAQVAATVLKKNKDALFGIIGEGELKEEMSLVFDKLGVADQVVFTGRLPYPFKALKNAKCLLMCSRYEGLPIAALEAMALGIPIISTPVDGMKELILNNETGYLLDDDTDLANLVSNVIVDKKLQEQLSKNTVARFKILNDELSYKERLKELYIRATV